MVYRSWCVSVTCKLHGFVIFIIIMESLKAKEIKYHILKNNEKVNFAPFPYLRDADGDKIMWSVSPNHGRSYVVDKDKGKYIISKGNGLSYTQYKSIYTSEYGNNIWGLSLREDAERDFLLGLEIQSLGIKTNTMECVLELEYTVQLTNGVIIKPVLLQYSVECPYRIYDTAYMPKVELEKQVNKWERLNKKDYDKPYLIAADILVSNLRTMHSNNILHNAIHPHNYTWALELLDFELSYSPRHPYLKREDNEQVAILMKREILQTYEVIKHIAFGIGDNIDYAQVDNIFDEYGFDLSKLKV